MRDEAPSAPARRRARFWPWLALVAVALPFALAWAAAWYAHRSSPQWVFRAGLDAFHHNDLDAVWTAAEALADVEGYEPHVGLLEGMVHLRAGRLAQAIDTLEVAKDHPDTGAMAFTLAGEALYKLRRFRDADGILKAAVELDPSLTDAHRWLAALYYDIGAFDHALAELQVISEQAPDDPRPYRLRGLIYKDFENEYERDAVHEYRESLRRDPDQPDRQQIRLELAECLVKQTHFDEAMEAIGPCENSADVLAIRAQCYAGKGDKASARRLLGEALARDPDHLASMLRLASLDLESGDAAAAARTLRHAVDRYPKDPEVRYRLSQAYDRLGQPKAAEEQLKLRNELRDLVTQFSRLHGKAVAAPADADLRYQLGVLAGQLDKPELARSWFMAALALDPNHAEARRALRALAAPPRQQTGVKKRG